MMTPVALITVRNVGRRAAISRLRTATMSTSRAGAAPPPRMRPRSSSNTARALSTTMSWPLSCASARSSGSCSSLSTAGSLRSSACTRRLNVPSVSVKVDPPSFCKVNTLRRQTLPLLRRILLRQTAAAVLVDHAMPGQAGRTGTHGPANSPRRPWHLQSTRDLAIRHHMARGNTRHDIIDPPVKSAPHETQTCGQLNGWYNEVGIAGFVENRGRKWASKPYGRRCCRDSRNISAGGVSCNGV